MWGGGIQAARAQCQRSCGRHASTCGHATALPPQQQSRHSARAWNAMFSLEGGPTIRGGGRVVRVHVHFNSNRCVRAFYLAAGGLGVFPAHRPTSRPSRAHGIAPRERLGPIVTAGRVARCLVGPKHLDDVDV